MDTGRLIEKRRKELGMTLEEVGDCVGVGKSTVRKWECGMIENMGRDKISQLASCLQISPLALLDETEKHDPYKNRIPVLGVIPCGTPIEAIEDIEEYIDYPSDSNKVFYGLRAKGDSMSPDIKNGDILVVEECSLVPSGSIAIVKVNGDDATCKKIQISDNGITLIPLNNNYDVVTYNKEQCAQLPVTICGKVVEVRHKF